MAIGARTRNWGVTIVVLTRFLLWPSPIAILQTVLPDVLGSSNSTRSEETQTQDPLKNKEPQHNITAHGNHYKAVTGFRHPSNWPLGGNDSKPVDNVGEGFAYGRTGIVLGLFYFPTFVLGLPVGWLVTAIGANQTFLLGTLFYIGSCLLFGFADTYLTLAIAATVCGIADVLFVVSGSSIITSIFHQDSSRSRIVASCYLLFTSSNALYFVLGPITYQYTPFATFGGLAALCLTATVSFVALTAPQLTSNCRIWTNSRKSGNATDSTPMEGQNHEARLEDSNNQKIPNGSSIDQTAEMGPKATKQPVADDQRKGYRGLLTNRIAVTAYLQFFLVYTGFSTVVATAPTWIQSTLRISVVGNGAILSVSSVVDVALLVVMVLFVTTNRRRWITMTVFIGLQSTGFLVYPHVKNMYHVMLTETAIRGAKAVTMALGHSLAFHIVDVENVGDYACASAMYVASKSAGQVAGLFVSGWIVESVGFRTVYLATGVLLIPMSLVSMMYTKLDRK